MTYSDLKLQLLPLLQHAAQHAPLQPVLWMSASEEEEIDKSEPSFAALARRLLEAEEFAMFRRGNVQYLPNFAGGTSVWYLAKWLIDQCRFRNDAEAPLDDLFTYVENPETLSHHVQPLAEINVHGLDEPFQFSNGVMLRHAGGVPNATLASQITRWDHGVPSPKYHFALTKEHFLPVSIGSNVDNRQHLEQLCSSVEMKKSSQELEDVALCLSLVSDVNNGVFGGPQTFVPDMRVPFATDGGTWALVSSAVPTFFLSLTPVEVERAARFTAFLDQLEPAAADRIRVPLRHLNLYGARLSLVEKAIHLRVALETTFLSKDSGPGLAERISIRAAIVGGSELAERRSIKHAVNKAYGLASTAVHKGALKDTEAHRLTDAADICQKALRLLLTNGGLPDDWFELDTEGFKPR